MAITATFTITNIQNGENQYFLKDAISGYQTETQVQDLIDAAIADITQFKLDGPYPSLATLESTHPTGELGTIYLVGERGAVGPDGFEEYIWIQSGSAQAGADHYELIGTTDIDLTGYVAYGDTVTLSGVGAHTHTVSLSGSYTPAGSLTVTPTTVTPFLLSNATTFDVLSSATYDSTDGGSLILGSMSATQQTIMTDVTVTFTGTAGSVSLSGNTGSSTINIDNVINKHSQGTQI